MSLEAIPVNKDPNKNLLVLGGSGLLGKAICREAIHMGFNVTSLSRNGAPFNELDDALIQVNWLRGNALDRKLLETLVKDKTHVVHVIGSLWESNPFSNLFNVKVKYETSYQAAIRDTTETMVKAICENEAGATATKSVGYVSASRFGLFGSLFLSKYNMMKLEAEKLLLQRQNMFRSVIVRPGYLYGKERRFSTTGSYLASVANIFTFGGIPQPLHVEKVAKVLLREIVKDPSLPSVILDVPDIEAANTYLPPKI